MRVGEFFEGVADAIQHLLHAFAARWRLGGGERPERVGGAGQQLGQLGVRKALPLAEVLLSEAGLDACRALWIAGTLDGMGRLLRAAQRARHPDGVAW